MSVVDTNVIFRLSQSIPIMQQQSNLGFSESRLRLMGRLEHYYRIVSSIILSKQHPCTGLMPASVAVNSHGDYRDAWVRDNVYSILAVFGLALAYRRLDDDSGRAYELEHAVVKLMRGLLFAMMRQAEKVELFKNHQSTDNALHAKYSTSTGGTVVGDKEWGHLQLDATSIYLLALAEMTASGLQIIFTNDEVDFIQNLVFYIERAYRTPDYGIWERGNKINHGMPELNSSSIGMVVAAMQAINGVNLFGAKGGPSSVIHALPDEITRNYTTLHSALPRESNSKEIDSALLSVIGYPAFAVHDSKLLAKTRSEIETKLRGRWGCKRFLRDGHQTVLEDTRRLHYDSHELKGLFNGDDEQVRFYREALKPCLVDSSVAIQREHESLLLPQSSAPVATTNSNSSLSVALTPSPTATIHQRQLPRPQMPSGVPLVPELFIVPKQSVPAEKRKPNSQERVANENLPLVWAQSLYVLSELLYEGLLAPTEIDPIGRHLLPRLRSQKTDTIVQVVLIAEDEDLQSRLSTFGIDTQTPEQIEPITVLRPSALVEAYSVLGANAKLGLSGRPKRPIGSLGTSKIYRVEGRLYAFTPQFMDKEEFYMTIDNDYLVSVLQHELLFIKNHWWYSGRPTLILYLTHNMMDGLLTSQSSRSLTAEDSLGLSSISNQFSFVSSRSKNAMLNMINSLKSGSCGEVRVRLGRIQELVATSCVESLDFLTSKLEQGYLIRNDVHLNWKDILGRSFAKSRPLGPDYAPAPLLVSDSKSEQARVRRNIAADKVRSPLLTPTAPNIIAMEALSLNPCRINEKPKSTVQTTTPSKRERTKSQEIREFKLKSKAAVVDTKSPVSPMTVLPRRSQDLNNRSPSPARFGSQLILDYGDSRNLGAAVGMLSTSTSLEEQLELLEYLHSCVGLDYTVSLHENIKATVKELLEEVYQMSAKRKIWSIVRRTAGLLQKVVNSLTINVSSMLTRRKQVTIGIGMKEVTVSAPLGPAELEKIIFNCSTSDPREPSLIQEVLTYLGTYIRTQPSLFDGILRIRIHYIVIAMREEISRLRHCDEESALEFMMQLCPFEIKSLLGYVLSAHQSASLKSCNSPTTDADSPEYSRANHNGIEWKSVTLSVKSCGYHDGNSAEIQLNGQKIIDSGDRGINVVIISPFDGSIIANTYFDTHFSKEDSDDFATLIESLEPDTIVAIAAKDDAYEQLTEGAKLACESLGSSLIRQMSYRDSWCFVGQKGNHRQETVEKLNPSKSGSAEILEKAIRLAGAQSSLLNESSIIVATDILPNGGAWLRRRKIDGALQRTPPGFYAKVYKILERSVSAIAIGDVILPRDPTVSETTPEEINFALHVEGLLNALIDPAERQLAVDSLMVIYEMEQRNPEIKIGGGSNQVDLLKVIRQSYLLFWDHWLPENGPRVFGGMQSVATPLRSASSQSIESQESSSAESQQTLGSKQAIPDSEWIKHHSFTNHEQLGRRLFFDLEQDGKHGAVSYLLRSIMQTMPYQIDLKTKISAALQDDANTNESVNSCWTM